MATQLRDSTRIFCTSWVNSFTGHTIDLDPVGRVCHAAGVRFVLNASQALGARVLDISGTEVDAVVGCGYKWLLCPYGTDFAWLRPEFHEHLTPPHAYWLPNVWGQGERMARYDLRPNLGARAFDVFDTATSSISPRGPRRWSTSRPLVSVLWPGTTTPSSSG